MCFLLCDRCWFALKTVSLTVFAHHSLVLLELTWSDVNPGAWSYLDHFVPAAVALLLVRVVRIDLDRIDAVRGPRHVGFLLYWVVAWVVAGARDSAVTGGPAYRVGPF